MQNLTTAIAHRAATRSLLGMTGHHRAADSDFAHGVLPTLRRHNREVLLLKARLYPNAHAA